MLGAGHIAARVFHRDRKAIKNFHAVGADSGFRARAMSSAGHLVCALIVLTATVRVQTPEDYAHLVDTYAAGDIQSAVARLSRWSRAQVTDAVEAMARTAEERSPFASVSVISPRLYAAAMLQTDLAAALLSPDIVRSDFHLGLARRLVDRAAARKDQDSRAREFVKRWYEFTPSLFLATSRLDLASLYVRDGLLRSPGDPVLYYYRGAIAELRAGLPAADFSLRGINPSAARADRALDAAAAEYRRALAVDGHLAPALLHLGWVHAQQHDSRARTDLESALANASDVTTRYLAHLFLGAVAQHDKRLDDAMYEYEEARAVGPRYQTAYIAIAHVAEMLGDVERARRAASTLAEVEKHEDPWWDYRFGGLDLGALAWLRAAALGL